MGKQKLKIWRMGKDIKLPEVMKEDSVGYDICASREYTFEVGDFYIVQTNLVAQVPKGYHIEIALRSSLPKRGLAIPNGLGIIDFSYCGEEDLLGVPIFKFGEGTSSVDRTSRGIGVSTRLHRPTKIEAGERIAQLIIRKTYKFDIEDMTGTENTNKSRLGFGSTGRK